jgi:iron complex outermembrane recepter protein
MVRHAPVALLIYYLFKLNYMYSKYIFVIILLFSFHFAFAQNALHGRITNAQNQTPLVNAIVYCPDLKISAATDSDGVYTLNNLPEGDYHISVHLLGFENANRNIHIKGPVTENFELAVATYRFNELIFTGTSIPKDNLETPQPVLQVSEEYLAEHSATNVIDAIANLPGVAGIQNGQSISKPVIRGLGYNRVLTISDGVALVDQPWFDEFGIEVDPDAVQRVEILKGPGSLAYGSDAIAGVINLVPETVLPEGQIKGEMLNGYQTNNGLINNMLHLAGTNKGISWSGRIDNMMAHAYQNAADGFVLNSQFSNFNADGSIGIHRKWGYTQIHASYFDMQTGIVDGTRDSASGLMMRQVAYPDLNGGAATYELPTNQELTSYTPFCINQRIRHTKLVWDNSIAIGEGRLKAVFSFQKNQRQETNDPTMPNTPDIYYSSNAATYDLQYISKQMGNFNFSTGVNGMYQASQSLGTLMLIPDYNIVHGGVFFIANHKIGKLSLSGGVRYDIRTFQGVDHWVDSTQVPVAANTPDAIHEFQGFTANFNGFSGSIGATYQLDHRFYLKGNIARGYRAPNVAECAANGVHDGTVIWEIGDQNLSAESSLEEDVTFGMVGKNMDFEVNIFNNSIDNFIHTQGLQSVLGGDSINNTLQAAGLGDAPVYKYVQSAVQLYGGEAALNIHPEHIPWLGFNAGFSMTEGGLVNVPETTRYLPFVPPARLTADIKFKAGKLGNYLKNAYLKIGMTAVAEQNHVYLGEAAANGFNQTQSPQQYAASQAATAGYFLLNAGIGGEWHRNGRTIAKLYITGNNLLNTVYMDYLSRFKYYGYNYSNNRVGVYNMGTNISLKLIIPIDVKQ